jgi:hypothetical protein
MDQIQAVESPVNSLNGRLDFDCAITARGLHALTPTEHLIRSSGQVVQDRLVVSALWTDVPGLSARDQRCPAAWLQYWQQSPASQPLASTTKIILYDTCLQGSPYEIDMWLTIRLEDLRHVAS